MNVIQLFTALNSPISCCEYQDDKHGRLVNRRVEVYGNDIDLDRGWEGTTRFAKVRRWGTRNGKDFEEVSYYLLSKPINHANLVAEAIQQHWSIENKLHWNKDVQHGERHDPSPPLGRGDETWQSSLATLSPGEGKRDSAGGGAHETERIPSPLPSAAAGVEGTQTISRAGGEVSKKQVQNLYWFKPDKLDRL